MEQIVVTRTNGSQYKLVERSTATWIKSAEQSCTLLGDDVVDISIESAMPKRYELGDTISVFGKTYRLNQLPNAKKEGARKFTYNLRFESIQYDLLRVIYDLTTETTGKQSQDVQADALIGDLKLFAAVLVANANRVFPGKWELGSCPETVKDKTLTFAQTDTCLSVYQNLCKAFDVEGSIKEEDGKYKIYFLPRIGQTLPYCFEYGKGKGLYSLQRQNVDSSNVITRLKVYGSTENITTKYRATRLCLPGKNKGQSFIEKSEQITKYGVHEAVKIFDDVKPTFNGSVTNVSGLLSFSDSSMFDLNEREANGNYKYRIPGSSPKIHFNSGALAGYEFDVVDYDHYSHSFTIRQIKDGHGGEFPSNKNQTFKINIADQYKILGVKLPESYEHAAENELLEKGKNYYNQNSQPKVKYNLEISNSFIRKTIGNQAAVADIFSVGDYIRIKDTDLGVDKAVRIQSFTRNLTDEYDYKLTISDSSAISTFSRIVSELIEVEKIVEHNKLKDLNRARKGWRTTEELRGMVYDTDGYFNIDNIRPNSIDTNMLTVGAKSQQFVLVDVLLEANVQGNPNRFSASQGSLSHLSIDENAIRNWELPKSDFTLQNQNGYYLLAKCAKNDNSGVWMLSQDQKKVEDESDPNNFYFQVGILGSLTQADNFRDFITTYGFTRINGSTITTGKIVTSDGQCYLDLDGNKFRVGDSSSSLTWQNGRLVLKGSLVQSPSGDVSEIGVYRGYWSSQLVYHKGDEVSYTSSGETCTYRYINDTPASNKRPTQTSYWQAVAKGKDGSNGAPGVDGRTSYLHIAYANTSSGGGFSQNPAGKKYIGTYTDFVQTDSNDPSRYKWALIKGEDGEKGEKGEKGDSPVCVFRGEYKTGAVYFGTPLRRDVVKHNATYYIAKPNAGTFSFSTPSNNSNSWENFGSQFSSVATELLLAENAQIGDWYLSGGKIVSTLNDNAENGKITLDAKNSKIEVKSKMSNIEDYYDKGNITLDSRDGTIKIESPRRYNASGAALTELSQRGISANHPHMSFTAYPSDNPFLQPNKGSIIVQGETNEGDSIWKHENHLGRIVAGIYGEVDNKYPLYQYKVTQTPTYGGYFRQLKAAGLSLRAEVLEGENLNMHTSRTLEDYSLVIARPGSSWSLITLPHTIRDGVTIFAHAIDGANITVRVPSPVAGMTVKLHANGQFVNGMDTYISGRQFAIITGVRINKTEYHWYVKCWG